MAKRHALAFGAISKALAAKNTNHATRFFFMREGSLLSWSTAWNYEGGAGLDDVRVPSSERRLLWLSSNSASPWFHTPETIALLVAALRDEDWAEWRSGILCQDSGKRSIKVSSRISRRSILQAGVGTAIGAAPLAHATGFKASSVWIQGSVKPVVISAGNGFTDKNGGTEC